jgi:hypothetical protein
MIISLIINAYWSRLVLFLCVIGLMIVIRPPHNDNTDDDKNVDDDDAEETFDAICARYCNFSIERKTNEKPGICNLAQAGGYEISIDQMKS